MIYRKESWEGYGGWLGVPLGSLWGSFGKLGGVLWFFFRFSIFTKIFDFRKNRKICTFSKDRPGFDPKIGFSIIFCSGKPVSKVEKSKITKNQKLKFFDPGLGQARLGGPFRGSFGVLGGSLGDLGGILQGPWLFPG